MNPLTQSKNATILPVLIVLTLGCFGLPPQAGAVCQEGCLTNFNTVLGNDALLNNTTGYNTAIGAQALFSNTDGSLNTAIGFDALYSNTGSIDNDGYSNTAIGAQALFSNTTGSYNTAIGVAALLNNTTGSDNTAIGLTALLNNTGSYNTAIGVAALLNNTGYYNTANGSDALLRNTTGNDNTAIGFDALLNTTGSNNIALGASAGYNLTTGGNNIYIGSPGVAAESNRIRIGTRGTQTATFIAGISGVAVNGRQVVVSSNGKLGVTASSERFKDEIKPMDKTSEAILALKPVTFRYKKEFDPKGAPQFGLVAEEVEKVNPDLVARDEQGKPYTVRYEAVNAMLLNEFLKEHRNVQQLQTTVGQQQAQIEALTTALKAQAAQIQKVSDQLKTQAVAPLVVADN